MPRERATIWTETDVRTVFKLRDQGLKYREIAEYFGLPEDTGVMRIRLLVHRVSKNHRPLTTSQERAKSERSKLVAEYIAVGNMAALARKYGVSISAIHARLAKEGMSAEVLKELKREIDV